METLLFYVFEPTPLLLSIAHAAGQPQVAQPSVWLVREHDRVGPEYSKEDLSRAHWLQFIANLVGDEDDTTNLAELREKCLALGFSGCWVIVETKIGGEAADLIEEAQSAQEFLNQQNIEI